MIPTQADEAAFWSITIMLASSLPILILGWIGGHRFNLKQLRDGKSFVVDPTEEETAAARGYFADENVYTSPAYLGPYRGPMMYLGPTTSAGMLRRWSIAMVVACLLCICIKKFYGDQVWFCLGAYVSSLLGVGCLFDIPLVADSLKRPVLAFSLANFALGLALWVSCAYRMDLVLSSDVPFYYGASTSLLTFLWIARIRVSPNDILYQIKNWKKHHKKWYGRYRSE